MPLSNPHVQIQSEGPPQCIPGGVELTGKCLHLGTPLAEQRQGTAGLGVLLQDDFSAVDHLASSFELTVHRMQTAKDRQYRCALLTPPKG